MGNDQSAVTIQQVVQEHWPVLAISLGLSLLLTPICRAIALRYSIVDRPDQWLKPHEKPIPYLGGVAIFAGWAGGMIYALMAFDAVPAGGAASATGPVIDYPLMIGIILAGTMTMLLGLADDLRFMSPKVKLAGNVAAALVLIAFGLGDDIVRVVTVRVGVTIDADERWLELLYSVPMTVFIVVGACNATNLIDGLDGLCSGVLGIISIGFLLLAVHLNVFGWWNEWNAARVSMSLAMVGGAFGFLPYNRNPARIFMGDAGSMLLGLNAAVMLLLFAEGRSLRWMLASVVVFGLPVADMVLTLVRRWRAQRPLMHGDRSHFYDQLIDRGYTVRQVVAVSYLLTAGFVVLGCLPMFMRMRHYILIYGIAAVALAFAVHRLKMVRTDVPPAPRNTEVQ